MKLMTILVEDSKTIRDSLVPAMDEFVDVQMLATAETATEAIEALEEHKGAWQLAIVDLFLREGSGLTVLNACRSRAADQHVVVLTNYPTPEMRRRCAQLGADAVFDKSNELDLFFAFCNSFERRGAQPVTPPPKNVPES